MSHILLNTSRPKSRSVPGPLGSGSATSLRRITVMRQAAAARSFSVPMVANAPGSAMAGLPGTGVLGMMRGGVFVQWCVGFILLHDGACSLSCVVGCRCKRVLRIDLVLKKIGRPLVSKGLRNRLLGLALEAYTSIALLHIPYFSVLASMYEAQSLNQPPS